MTYNNKAAVAKATKAAKAAKAITKGQVVIKDDGYSLIICIGYTDDDMGDAAYRAASAVAPNEMAADINGGGVTIVTVV